VQKLQNPQMGAGSRCRKCENGASPQRVFKMELKKHEKVVGKRKTPKTIRRTRGHIHYATHIYKNVTQGCTITKMPL